MSKLGKMILAICGKTLTGAMVLNRRHIKYIVSACGCLESEVQRYAIELGVEIL